MKGRILLLNGHPYIHMNICSSNITELLVWSLVRSLGTWALGRVLGKDRQSGMDHSTGLGQELEGPSGRQAPRGLWEAFLQLYFPVQTSNCNGSSDLFFFGQLPTPTC